MNERVVREKYSKSLSEACKKLVKSLQRAYNKLTKSLQQACKELTKSLQEAWPMGGVTLVSNPAG